MRKKLLVLLGVALLLFLFLGAVNNLLSSWLVPMIGDSMDWRSRWFMGRHGIDCGEVKVHGDPTTATNCVLRADAQGRPFHAHDPKRVTWVVAAAYVSSCRKENAVTRLK